VDAGRRGEETDGGEHRGAAVLNFGRLEPPERFLAPEAGEVEGIEALDRQRVSRQPLEAGLQRGGGNLHTE